MTTPPPVLFVAFKRAGQSTLERAAGLFGKYVHCEIVLCYPDHHYESFSAYMGAGVCSQSRWKHDPEMWTLVDTTGLVPRVDDVIAYCERAVRHRVDYDTVGAVCSVAPMPMKWLASLFGDDEKSEFCSEFTLRAMMEGGFATDVNPQLVSPMGLWELVTHARARAEIAMRGLVL